MKKISEMSNEKLKEKFQAYYEIINKIGCYGTKDLRMYDALEFEIFRRGGEIGTVKTVEFKEV